MVFSLFSAPPLFLLLWSCSSGRGNRLVWSCRTDHPSDVVSCSVSSVSLLRSHVDAGATYHSLHVAENNNHIRTAILVDVLHSMEKYTQCDKQARTVWLDERLQVTKFAFIQVSSNSMPNGKNMAIRLFSDEQINTVSHTLSELFQRGTRKHPRYESKNVRIGPWGNLQSFLADRGLVIVTPNKFLRFY